MADTKRKEPDSYGAAAPARGNGTALVKRARQDADGEGAQQVAISSAANGKDKGLIRSVRRTSSLAAPILALTGAHGAEVLDVAFSPDGAYIAACSIDRTISLWTTYGENSNLGLLAGHSKAVTALCWSRQAPSHTPRLFTASADATLIVWDALNGQKLRRLRGHHGIINAVAVSRAPVRGAAELLVSGGDDGNVMLWDWENSGKPRDSFRVGYPVTAVEFSEDGSQVYVGGLDNEIHVYELAKKEIVFSLRGHTDTILCARLSPSGTQLLSTSADGTVRLWDVRPFAPEPAPGHVGAPRLIRTLAGLPIGFEQVLIRGAWAADGRRVIAGGGDGTMSLWNTETGELVYKLPGHKGSVPSVSYHPKEPIVVSCSFDMGLILGEVEP